MSANPRTITAEMVDDVLTTAMDSGSAYWTAKVRVIGTVGPEVVSTLFPGDEPFTSEMLTKGFDLKWETDDGQTLTLTLAKMKRGIRKAADHYGQTPLAFVENNDADSADVAVQFALFDEIVYG